MHSSVLAKRGRHKVADVEMSLAGILVGIPEYRPVALEQLIAMKTSKSLKDKSSCLVSQLTKEVKKAVRFLQWH